MSPCGGEEELDEDRDDVDDHGKEPGDDEIRSSPEEPCVYVVFDELTFGGRMRFVPVKVDDEGRGDEYAREDN